MRRWTSTLVALHMLRYGADANIGAGIQNVWWDVGNAARKSKNDRTVPIANADLNWAQWMYLGWSFDPSGFSGVGARATFNRSEWLATEASVDHRGHDEYGEAEAVVPVGGVPC